MEYWHSAKDLGLGNHCAAEWKSPLKVLNHSGIRLSCANDEILWTCNVVNGKGMLGWPMK